VSGRRFRGAAAASFKRIALPHSVFFRSGCRIRMVRGQIASRRKWREPRRTLPRENRFRWGRRLPFCCLSASIFNAALGDCSGASSHHAFASCAARCAAKPCCCMARALPARALPPQLRHKHIVVGCAGRCGELRCYAGKSGEQELTGHHLWRRRRRQTRRGVCGCGGRH